MGIHDFDFLTASALSRLFRTRKISSIELTRHFVERLEKLGPHYNALAEITRNLAMTQARQADKLLRDKAYIGRPLLGIPYGVKDLFATKNIPTRWGSISHKRQIFDYDATVIRKMHDAAAVLIGKFAMIELAGAGEYASANASLHGPGLNPWNRKHWSGGSSSGSASVVAAGLVPFSLATETWGSIIIPAAYCGITGLRPTWGRVSRHGTMELAWNMDKVGPMARSAEDCGRILQAIAGADLLDESTSSHSTFKFKSQIQHKSFHLGVLATDFTGQPKIEQAFEEALRVLRQNSIKLTNISLPKYPYDDLTTTLLGGEIAAVHEKFIKSKCFHQLVDSHQKHSLKKYLSITASQYLQALHKRNVIAKQIFEILDRFDAVISPSLMKEAPILTANLLETTSKTGNDYNVLGALLGLPALSVPMGFGQQNLPLGLCINGKLFEENTLLQIGMIFQRDTDWHKIHPVVHNDA